MDKPDANVFVSCDKKPTGPDSGNIKPEPVETFSEIRKGM
jgi:hypothetical protein